MNRSSIKGVLAAEIADTEGFFVFPHPSRIINKAFDILNFIITKITIQEPTFELCELKKYCYFVKKSDFRNCISFYWKLV